VSCDAAVEVFVCCFPDLIHASSLEYSSILSFSLARQGESSLGELCLRLFQPPRHIELILLGEQKDRSTMVMNTATVGAAVTPAVVETFFSHVSHLPNSKALLIIAVPAPETPSSEAHGSHLLRRGIALNSQVFSICFPSYCRGNSALHFSMGSTSALGQG
jgi:hypothetical protein